MEIAYAIVASGAHTEPDGRLFLLNGAFDTVNLVPAHQAPPAPLYLAGKINFLPEECGREYEIRVDVLDPRGDIIQNVPQRITPAAPPPPFRFGKAAFLLQFYLGVNVAGLYTFRVSVDGRRVTEVDLNLVAPPPQ